jgi:hypothetical protein
MRISHVQRVYAGFVRNGELAFERIIWCTMARQYPSVIQSRRLMTSHICWSFDEEMKFQFWPFLVSLCNL